MSNTQLAGIGDLPLRSGGALPGAELAYVTYGELAADGRNAVLLTHGYTSSHLFADGGSGEGDWSALVGPGRPIDTDRLYVVSSNMLGSSYGSTAPRSINPATHRPYGSDFPRLTVADIVAAQRRLLDQLGVKHLLAVVGPSYGGAQAFTWGVEYPDFMSGLVPVCTGIRFPGRGGGALRERFAADPGWNGGDHYAAGGMTRMMTTVREETLRNYGIEAELTPRFPDPAERAAEITRQARAWAEVFDPNSMIALADAAATYDVTAELGRIQARVLYVLSRTDAIFPPSLAEGVLAALRAAGVDADYALIDSDFGHRASGADAAKWAPSLRAFMNRLS